MKPRVKSMIWIIKKQKTTNQNNEKKIESKKWADKQLPRQEKTKGVHHHPALII